MHRRPGSLAPSVEGPLRIAAIAASNRSGSLNRELLAAVVEALSARSVEVDVIDLRTLPLPLYDADLQARDGMPAEADALHERLAAADGVVLAVPEYNGGYPALLKNAIDWVSRIDMLILHPRYVGLASATPGRGGGQRGLEHTRALLANMFVTTHDDLLTVPKADVALADGVDPELAERIAAWADGFADALARHAEERRAA